jgi:ATP-dependent helicase/nuclease subunit B
MTKLAGTVYTIEPGRPFLEALARAVLDGNLPTAGGPRPAPLDLPAWTILLPSRRATRALQEAFLDAGGGRAMLLPTIRPIVEVDEDLDLIERATVRSRATDDAELAPAVDTMTRRLVLTRLVMAWSESLRRSARADDAHHALVAGAQTPAQAIGMADALAALMDIVETENVSLSGLEGLVPEEHAEHWQQTLAFLNLIIEHWPQWLAEQQLLSPRHRRNLFVLAEARRLLERPPTSPIIIAGVTGSVPATAELMRAVLAHEKGAVVLPGLDLDLDEASWQMVREGRPEHPQYGFSRLLHHLELERSDVCVLTGTELSAPARARNDVVRQALRPTGTLHHWRAWGAEIDRDRLAEALSGVSRIAAPSAEAEAEAIALVMRRAAETPGQRAALVTPDRLLARRVVIRLASWGIRVDDSAGRPLRKTLPGAFLDLIAEVLVTDFAPAELMSLLKHPLTRLGLQAGPMRRAARLLELAAFRRPYLGRGFDGIEAALEAGAPGRLSAPQLEAARDLVARLQAAFQPWIDLARGGERLPLASFAAAHGRMAEVLATPADDEVEPVSPVWQEEAGEALTALFAGLVDPSRPAISLTPSQYADVWRVLVANETVRPRIPVHPRLFIWGPLEARLQQPDVLILGSLVEGTWPQIADPGPWLDRGMRKRLALPAPEEEIGRAAHDFASFMGSRTVVLTHAAKVSGTPTVPSRWLQRLDALLGSIDMRKMLEPTEPWLAWARARDAAGARPRARAPAPRPAHELRPRRVSVSEVETWLANPYALYARRILKLQPLPPLGREPGPQERGTMLHSALSRFAETYPDALPTDIAGELMLLADDVVKDMTGVPRVAAFWLPRLERFARWFATTEPARRRGVTHIAAEVVARHMFDAPGGPFELRARADRIDVTNAGAIVTDYKTGAAPTAKKMEAGFAPQLPLEAALLRAGAFTGIEPMPITALRYIRASGGEPPGREDVVADDPTKIEALATSAFTNLGHLIATYDNPDTPYPATRKSGFIYAYDDYAHLARVQEWLGADDDEEEDAP